MGFEALVSERIWRVTQKPRCAGCIRNRTHHRNTGTCKCSCVPRIQDVRLRGCLKLGLPPISKSFVISLARLITSTSVVNMRIRRLRKLFLHGRWTMNLFRIHSVLDGIREKTLTHDSKRRLVWSAVFEDGMTAAQIYADPELAVYASGMDIVLDRWIRERDGSQPRPEIHVLWLQGELSSLSLLSAVRSELSKRFGAAWGSGLWVTLHSRSFRAIRVLLWLACLARWNVRRLTLICPSSAISRRCRFVEPISRLSGLVGSLR